MPAYKDKARGTWYVKYSQTADGKRKQILKRGFATKHDAQDWEASQRGKSKPDSATFSEMVDQFHAFNAPKEHTKEVQLFILKKHFKYYDTPMNRIRKSDLVAWYTDFIAKDLKASTKNLIIGMIKSVYKFASVTYDMPNTAAILKRLKEPKRKYTTWSPEQFAQFLSVVDLEYYRAVFSFIYYTGVRKSEALGIRKKDVGDDWVHVRGTKTETSDRVLRITPSLRAILEPILERTEKDDDLIFPIPAPTMQYHFKRYTEESGLPPIRIHDLRHSFATNLIGSGANIVAVSKYLGHSTTNQTLNTYAHLFQKADDEMLDMINGIISVSNSKKSQ
jgi:integrase